MTGSGLFRTLAGMMSRSIGVQFNLRAGVKYDDAAGVYVSCCPALDVLSQGDTIEEAKEALTGAIVLYLRHCYSRKILDDVLMGRGFLPSTGASDAVANPGEFINIQEFGDMFDLQVPFNLIQNASASGDVSCLS